MDIKERVASLETQTEYLERDLDGLRSKVKTELVFTSNCEQTHLAEKERLEAVVAAIKDQLNAIGEAIKHVKSSLEAFDERLEDDETIVDRIKWAGAVFLVLIVVFRDIIIKTLTRIF